MELPALPNKPFDLAKFIPIDRPLNAHFEEAIDGGKMDRYVAITGSPAMGHYDGHQLPMWHYAQQFVLADHFFQGSFGGTAINHLMLFCACAPVGSRAPATIVAQLAPDGTLLEDGLVTPDGSIVDNLRQICNSAPLQTMPHIGDRLDAAGVSRVWYSGGWNKNKNRTAVQPFLLSKNLARGTPGEEKHVKDEGDFLADLEKGALPQVAFVKPAKNEHPNDMSGLLEEDRHTSTW